MADNEPKITLFAGVAPDFLACQRIKGKTVLQFTNKAVLP